MTGSGVWIGTEFLTMEEWVTFRLGRRFKVDRMGLVRRSVADTSTAARRARR